jgi:formiminotetrahydrofolate cyclodeaminase
MTDTPEMLSMDLAAFAEATASKTPTPGGGSVAGLVGALGTALGEMALNFTRGKKKFAEHAETHEHLAARLGRARSLFCDLIADDLAAFGMLSEANRMDDGPEKSEAMSLALAAAINVPRETAKLCLAVLDDLAALQPICSAWLVSDLAAGAVLAAATVDLCDFNVRVNARMLDDAAQADEIRQASTADRRRAHTLAQAIETAASAQLD